MAARKKKATRKKSAAKAKQPHEIREAFLARLPKTERDMISERVHESKAVAEIPGDVDDATRSRVADLLFAFLKPPGLFPRGEPTPQLRLISRLEALAPVRLRKLDALVRKFYGQAADLLGADPSGHDWLGEAPFAYVLWLTSQELDRREHPTPAGASGRLRHSDGTASWIYGMKRNKEGEIEWDLTPPEEPPKPRDEGGHEPADVTTLMLNLLTTLEIPGDVKFYRWLAAAVDELTGEKVTPDQLRWRRHRHSKK